MRHARISLFHFVFACVFAFALVPRAGAQNVGSCEGAIGEDYLDINNVRARILNNGNLFYRGNPAVYEVPQNGGVSALFASGIWIGGLIDGQLRLAGATYGPYEFWAGPLDDAGNPPSDCSDFDNVWKVSKEDVVAYEGTGAAPPDLRSWPTGLGAPTIDADGNEIVLQSDGTIAHVDGDGNVVSVENLSFAERAARTINLGGGERPMILGDQMLWWIMNDRGNVHATTGGLPIGLEVHGSAFAFNTAGAIGNTTFYRYKMYYKGSSPLTQTYMALFSDPDLGNAFDDYVGSDTTLGLGFVYNADNDDESGGYGAAPPAVGYDFFQGPLVNDDGFDNDRDGEVDEEDERLKMTAFVFYNNDQSVTGDPETAEEFYGYMRARWRDGQPITLGGSGRDFSDTPTSFMFPGDPTTGAFWSELNADNAGTPISPTDRRFVMATGPFTIKPGDVQEIVFGIVWSRGSDNLNSVRQLKEDDALAQAVFDIDFELPSPPNAPRVSAAPLDGQVILTWENLPNDNNYLEQYRAIDPLLSEDVEDNDYLFEGYRIFRYASPQDQTGTLLATYDVPNGITRVIEGTELTFVTAEGSDAGVQHHHVVDGLTNYQEYYFGVQAYAFNAESGQKVYAGPVQRLTVIPAKVDATAGGTLISDEALEKFATRGGVEADVIAEKDGEGGGEVSVDVIDPSALTGHTYRVEFYEDCVPAGKQAAQAKVLDPVTRDPVKSAAKSAAADVCVTTYDIINTTTGAKAFDGSTALDITGAGAPQGRNVAVIDGLSFHVEGPPGSFLPLEPGDTTPAFVEIAGPGGIDACGEDAISTGGCDLVGGNLVYGSYNSTAEYIMYHADAGPEESIGAFSPHDFEIRFTEEGGYAEFYFQEPFNGIRVPFEVWDVGVIGAFGENDPADDVRLIPLIYADGGGTCEFAAGEAAGQFQGLEDWEITDRIYAYYGVDSYEAWAAEAAAIIDAGPDGCAPVADLEGMIDTDRGRPIQRVVFNMAPGVPYPGTGTVIRFLTTKPNLPGDVFTVNTEGLGAAKGNQAAAVDALDLIGIVPNPYKGASSYEVNQLNDLVRFTNLPQEATIRIFTLSGTLLRTLQKSSPEAYLEWDLTTAETLPLASGLYLIHIDVPEVGERVLKFAVVTKRKQLNTF